ncbi:DNA primase [Kamptonema formosum]|uniref:DNA primase n=1 Tax=Kamptonema formosum TaxID=331992 RepID=UPI00034DE6A3|nr:DNA primase [Oscillatoria sp. PCC 10802]
MDVPSLHRDTIEEVKQRADIVDVISERVVLKRRGKDFVGLCPFHNEKSPSFTVSPSKQMYYCFGCSAGGNAIRFLMQFEKRSFTEAVLDLAKRYGVPVRAQEPQLRQELQRLLSVREQLYEILAVAASFYRHALHEAGGQQALEYLQSHRHLSAETIEQFGLGYAPAGWEVLYRYLVEYKRQPVQLVEQAGLIAPRKSGDGYYDRFRDRIIIPIHDIQGRVIGFGGRTLTDEQPKYLNSPETELFDKGKTLFALDKAKTAIAKQDQAVVVEGYFDAIALHAAGITNAVASLGTALSLNQVRQLLRHTESKQIVLNFDADRAGTAAAERAIGEIAGLAYTGQVQLRVLNIPDGKDADEFLKNSGSPEPYRQLLATAPLWIDWQLEQLLTGADLKQAAQFGQVAQAMVKLLGNIVSDNLLAHYSRRCAELLSLEDSRRVSLLEKNLLDQIVRHWEKLLRQDASLQAPLFVANRLKLNNRNLPRRHSNSSETSEKILPVSGERNLLEQAEALLLRIYLHSPEHRQAVKDALEERNLQFSLSHHRFLWRQILELQPSLADPGQLISALQDRYVEFPKEMAFVSHLFYLEEKTKLDILRQPLVIRDAAAALERVMCEKRYRYFNDQWRQTDPKANPELAQFSQEQLYAEKARIWELDRQRHTERRPGVW